MYDLGIINGRVYTENGYINTNVFIKDGRISALSEDKLDCTEYVDADGAKVLPGLIGQMRIIIRRRNQTKDFSGFRFDSYDTSNLIFQ